MENIKKLKIHVRFQSCPRAFDLSFEIKKTTISIMLARLPCSYNLNNLLHNFTLGKYFELESFYSISQHSYFWNILFFKSPIPIASGKFERFV